MAAIRLDFPATTPADLRQFNPFPHLGAGADPPGPYRVGELSRLSGVAVGTIKYYLREGLLPAGKATAKTQALYGPEHLRRLRLVRVLADVGDLSIAQIRDVTGAIDAGAAAPGEIEQMASYSIGGNGSAAGPDPASEAGEVDAALAAARAATDAFVDSLGFEVDPSSPARAELAEALHALRLLDFADDPAVFYEHARLAYELGSFEIENSGTRDHDPATAVEAVMVGSVIFGAAFMALRRMAHEHETRRRLEAPG